MMVQNCREAWYYFDVILGCDVILVMTWIVI
jgi:hypothetical protein